MSRRSGSASSHSRLKALAIRWLAVLAEARNRCGCCTLGPVVVLPFIDVGDSQGSVDWERAVARGKAVIAACKATEGQDFRAHTFSAARVKAVHKAGLPLMPYHYLRPRTDRHGSKEAEFALAVLEDAGWRPRGKRFKSGTDTPLVMDIECKLNEAMLARMTGAQLLHYAEEFAGTVFEKTGRGVMTYLSPGFMPELGNRAPRHGEDVWVAAFSFKPGAPPVPAGFAKEHVRAHQFSEHGTFPGVGNPVDLDVWLGDAESLRSWIEGRPGTDPVGKPVRGVALRAAATPAGRSRSTAPPDRRPRRRSRISSAVSSAITPSRHSEKTASSVTRPLRRCGGQSTTTAPAHRISSFASSRHRTATGSEPTANSSPD